jgi:serine/threonine protein phosphatase PrpC
MLNEKLLKWQSHLGADRSVNSSTGMPIVLGTDRGLIRGENQDRVAVMRVNSMAGSNSPFVVIALVDGMGGMVDGNECAIKTVASFLNANIRFRHEKPEERLRFAAEVANEFVFKFSRGKGGATLSALLVTADGRAVTLNVGDSRIYASLGTGDTAVVKRLTVDDSLEEIVGGSGKELLQFIGMGDGLRPHIDEVPPHVQRLLLTSDGIHFVKNETLCEILLNAKAEQDVIEELLDLAKRRGSPDNATLSVVCLSKLRKSLLEIDETGIQFWDPFGALQVLWLKQEFVQHSIHANKLKADRHDQANGPAHGIADTHSSLSNNSDITPLGELSLTKQPFVRSRNTKNSTKKKSSRSNKNKQDQGNQLSIEIDSKIEIEK